MPITAQQREERKQYVGASDVAGLFGLDPYTTSYNIWCEKTGKLKDEEQNTSYAEGGNLFEPVVIDWAENTLGPIARDLELRYNDPNVPLVSHLDGQVIETEIPVEAKTSGMFGPIPEHWGEEYTDDIPQRVIVQTSAQMMCAGAEKAFVPVFLGGRGFTMYEVGIDDPDIFQMIADRIGSFWHDNVLKDIPPDDSQPTIDIVKRIIRTPKAIVEVDDADVEEWIMYRQERLKFEKAEKAALEKVLAQMGTAEGGRCAIGLVTYFEQHRKAYQVKAASFRVPRFKASK